MRTSRIKVEKEKTEEVGNVKKIELGDSLKVGDKEEQRRFR